MQLELKHIQREVGITFVYVTHDQEEALTMSDSIAVMNHGELQQVGNAEDVYERPANSFVAQFIGISNLLEATAERDGVRLTSGLLLPARVPADLAAGSQVRLSIRPEKLALGPAADGRVGVDGTIVESVYMGTVTHYVIEIAPGARMIAVTQNTEDASDGIASRQSARSVRSRGVPSTRSCSPPRRRRVSRTAATRPGGGRARWGVSFVAVRGREPSGDRQRSAAASPPPGRGDCRRAASTRRRARCS